MSEALAAIRHKRAKLHREYKTFKVSNYWERMADYLLIGSMAQKDLAVEAATEEERAEARAMVKAMRKLITLPREMFEELDADLELKEKEEQEELSAERGNSPDSYGESGSSSDPGV